MELNDRGVDEKDHQNSMHTKHTLPIKLPGVDTDDKPAKVDIYGAGILTL